jgi:hypothetical protein
VPLKAVQALLGTPDRDDDALLACEPDVQKDAGKLLDADPRDNRLTTSAFSNMTG